MVVTESKHHSSGDNMFFIQIFGFTVLVVFSYLFGASSQAGEWQFEPQVTSSLIHVDNITLTNSSNAESSSVFELTPRFSLNGAGRNLKASFDYQLQNLFYSNNPVEEKNSEMKQFHRLSTTANIEIVDRIIFMDASAFVNQQNSSSIGEGALDNVSLSEGRSTVKKLSISPFVHHMGSGGFITDLRYRADKLRDDDSVVNEADIQTLSLDLNSGQLAGRWQWLLSSQVRDLHYREKTDQKHYEAEIGLSYHLFPKTILGLNLGSERVEYQLENVDPTGGDFWQLDLQWRPGKRTSFTVGLGERYYGNSYKFNMEHTSRRARFDLGYSEDVTNRSLIQFEQEFFTLDGDPLSDITLLDITSSEINSVDQYQVLTYPVLSTEIIVRKRWKGRVRWKTGKTDLSFNASRTESNFQTSGDTERLNSAEASWQWRAQRNMSIALNGYYQHRRIISQGASEQLLRSEIKLSRTLWPGVASSLSIMETSRKTSDDLKNYDQQRIALAINAKW